MRFISVSLPPAPIPLHCAFSFTSSPCQAKKAEKLRQKLGQGGAAVPDFKPLEGWVAAPASGADLEDGPEVQNEGAIPGSVEGSKVEEGGGDEDGGEEEESAFNVPDSKYV